MERGKASTSMTVSLPAAQIAYVKARAAACGCDTSDYVQQLIHADQRDREREALEGKLLAGLDSPGRELRSSDWSELRSTLRTQLTERRSPR